MKRSFVFFWIVFGIGLAIPLQATEALTQTEPDMSFTLTGTGKPITEASEIIVGSFMALLGIYLCRKKIPKDG